MRHRIPRRLAVAALTTACLLAGTAQAQAYTKLVNQGNGLTLGIMNNGPAVSGAYLVANPYEGRMTQKWALTPKGNGYYWLRPAANTTLCARADGGPLRLGACESQAYSYSHLFLKAEPAGGSSIRPMSGWNAFGSPYANVPIEDLSPLPPSAWYRWNLIQLPTPAPQPPDDPFPPVCETKPSLPQCG